MAVLELGTLSLNRLIKPGKGWETGVEGVLLGVENSRWTLTDLAQEGSVNLIKAVEAFAPDTMNPGKLETLLGAEERKVAHIASALHLVECFVTESLEPEVRKVLAASMNVVGVALPRWQFSFVPMYWFNSNATYLWALEQINAYGSQRVKMPVPAEAGVL